MQYPACKYAIQVTSRLCSSMVRVSIWSPEWVRVLAARLVLFRIVFVKMVIYTYLSEEGSTESGTGIGVFVICDSLMSCHLRRYFVSGPLFVECRFVYSFWCLFMRLVLNLPMALQFLDLNASSQVFCWCWGQYNSKECVIKTVLEPDS